MDVERVHVSIQDRVALLAIDHPPVNTFDVATFKDLNDAFDRVSADRRVKVIVITGTGRSFIAGADVNELAALSDVQEAREKAAVGHVLFDKIWRSAKPVIAAINGRYCLGGGNELAIACHMRIAEEKVKFGQPEIKLGIIPGWGGTQRLPRLVGLGKAIEMILTGDHIRAQEAYRIGLVNKVVPAGEVVEEAMRVAGRMASLSSVAMAKALDAIRAGLELSLNEGLDYEKERFAEMAGTWDMREGLRAFLEKRSPEFLDR
jgi:enoyl-CoA hydratase/carnithine racemase